MSENKIETKVVCSKCGNESNIPTYNVEGMPYEFNICRCGTETEIHPKMMNAHWWYWMWMGLIFEMKKELGDPIVERMAEYASERRESTLEREYLYLAEKLGSENIDDTTEAVKEIGQIIRTGITRKTGGANNE